MNKQDEEKARELALEMGQEGSFMYSHAMSILTKMSAWKQEQLIEKVVEWLEEKTSHYINQYSEDDYSFDNKQFIKDFKKAMMEE